MSSAHIFFNRPFVAGKEAENVQHVLASRKFSGDGVFTRTCELFFEEKFGFGKTLLTPSCTHALEMAALLLGIKPGDEVIVPSYTFVSTANAFVLRGAKIVFADSRSDHPNVDVNEVAKLVTSKTKAIVVVHYGGMACDVDGLLKISRERNIPLIEDAAHAFYAKHGEKFLGTFGALSTMSFHETKNITSGEGGLIAINDSSLEKRAEIIREKGTNRKSFSRGETDHYSWVDLGSAYLTSEFSAAVLSAQLERAEAVSYKRVILWHRYHEKLKQLAEEGLIEVQSQVTSNGHIYYIVCRSLDERTALTKHLSANGIDAVFHYLSLHSSPYYSKMHDGRALPNSDKFMYRLLRLPMYYDLEIDDVDRVCNSILKFYKR